MTEGDRLSAIQRLNTISAEQAHRRAEQTRIETIDLVYEAVLLHLQADRETVDDLEERDFPKGEEFGLFVGEDMLAAPSTTDEYRRAFSILLVEEVDLTTTDEDDLLSNEDNDSEETEAPHVTRLKLYVPVGEDIRVEDFKMPDPKEVTEVYLEYSLDDSPPLRYMVSRDWMHEYVSAVDAGEEASPLSVEEFMRRTGTVVDEGVITIAQAFRNIINMHAIPQRYPTVGQSEVRDV